MHDNVSRPGNRQHVKMRMKFSHRLTSTMVLAGALAAGPATRACETAPPPHPGPEGEAAEVRFQDSGRNYVVARGEVYEHNDDGSRVHVAHLYDPGYFAEHYVVDDCKVFQRDPDSGQLYRVTRYFREGFEQASSVDDLISEARWHVNNTDPKRAGRNFNYADFGNTISLSRDVVHGGAAALRFHAFPRSGEVSKASLTKGIMYFKKGDHVYFSGWFYFEKTPSLYDGGSTTFFDLESSFVRSAGLRIIVRAGDTLAFELELPKTQFRQPLESAVSFPMDRWVHVATHAYLSDETGEVQIWQDGRKVLDAKGRTLPLADTVYDRFEIGISALATGADYEKVLYVDDIVISDKPIAKQ